MFLLNNSEVIVMNKFYLFIVLIIVFCSNIYAQIDSVWIGKSPAPCNVLGVDNDSCYRTSGWVGPKADTIDAGLTGAACNSDCYFVVVYYERFDTLNYDCYDEAGKTPFKPNEVIQYYPFISGFYWYGADNCYLCDSRKLEEYFIKKFYTDAEEKMPGLINDLSICYIVTPTDTIRTHCEGFPTYYYTVGKCLDSLGNECGPPGIQRCCHIRINVNSSAADTTHRVVDSLTYYPAASGPEPPCASGCEDDCDTKKSSMGAALGGCDLPCNDGPWIPLSKDSVDISHLLNGCTGFTIDIKYSYRNSTSPPCPKEYKDIRFDTVYYNGPDSCIMQLDPAQLSSFVNEWLLKESALNSLAPNECREQYRLVNALCVTGYDTVTKTALYNCNPINNAQYGCCWGQYMVCRNGGNKITFTKLDGTVNVGDTCQWFTRPCIPICEEVTHSLSADPNNPFGENSFEKIYLSMEEMNKGETLVISSVNSIENLKSKFISGKEIAIYDLFGKAVGNTDTVDRIYDNLDSGIYFILDKEGDNILKIIKIFVQK